MGTHWSAIVCVDWGKEAAKRRAWVADVAARTISRAPQRIGSLGDVMRLAAGREGRVLVGIDAALGVPRAYLERARVAHPAWATASDFPSWLVGSAAVSGFASDARIASEWTPARPFIAVPSGEGALRAFWAAAGGDLRRAVDRATQAKSPFVVSGIPGTVGSGSRVLWQELARRMGEVDRGFGLWPFEGTLDELARVKRIVLAEIYPRASYGVALAKALPARLRDVAKTKADARAGALAEMMSAGAWIARHGVELRDVDHARASEDDFDAAISAAALLRCVIEGHAMERAGACAIEGDILGMGAIEAGARAEPVKASTSASPSASAGVASKGGSKPGADVVHRCPIAGCPKVFRGSRGGWDAHVASLGAHPKWHPEEKDAGKRKAMFRVEHAAWFDAG